MDLQLQSDSEIPWEKFTKCVKDKFKEICQNLIDFICLEPIFCVGWSIYILDPKIIANFCSLPSMSFRLAQKNPVE